MAVCLFIFKFDLAHGSGVINSARRLLNYLNIYFNALRCPTPLSWSWIVIVAAAKVESWALLKKQKFNLTFHSQTERANVNKQAEFQSCLIIVYNSLVSFGSTCLNNRISRHFLIKIQEIWHSN